MRRTWSALRSIQVVVCLVLNVIEALVHPRHPPSASRSAPASWPSSTMLLEKLLEKLLGPRGMRDPPPGGAGRKASEEKRLRRTRRTPDAGIRIPRGRGRGKALSFSLPGAWRGRGDTTQETDFFACLRRA